LGGKAAAEEAGGRWNRAGRGEARATWGRGKRDRERERERRDGRDNEERESAHTGLRDLMEAGEWDTGVWGPCGLAGTHV
jgi:hypothetical protein